MRSSEGASCATKGEIEILGTLGVKVGFGVKEIGADFVARVFVVC